MQLIAIISSMPFESAFILSSLNKVRPYAIAGKPVYKGQLSGINVVLMNSGIGKVNAAHSVTCIIEKYPVNAIINTGVGGAYPGSGLNIGDIALASREIYGDDGVIDSGGWGGLEKIGIPLVQDGEKKYFNEFPVTVPPMVKKGKGGEVSFTIKTGRFVTVSAATGTQKRAKELEKRFNALCENMEGAAIAHVCALYGIPMVEVRGISNIVGTRDKRRWNLNLASENSQKTVLQLIKAYG
jgi:futalosine hydrolase